MLAVERFDLPAGLEASEPPEIRGSGRDDVRLLVSSGREGMVRHARFQELPALLRSGDVVVLNVSATVPASLRVRGAADDIFTLNVSTRLPGGLCVVEARDHAAFSGETLQLPGSARATLLAPYLDSHRLWVARFDVASGLLAYLARHGKPISYRHVRGTWPIDAYQNVFATESGSAEMPSAGRPFTHRMLAQLKAAGIRIGQIVLHTGVSSAERDEPPYEESFRVPAETAALVAAAKVSGHRVIAVGTSTVRALESAADDGGRITAAVGWTDLVITPHRRMRFVDGMLTGFHEPRSTHLAMLEALVGTRHVHAAYAHALSGGYLWHEFGDVHLLLSG